MRIDIITIFPEYFGPLRVSLIGKAAERGDITFGIHDLRSWTYDIHHTVDDTPFGGGPGMVMKPEPWGEALDAIATADSDPLLIVPTPSGVPFTQERAARYAGEQWLIFACGRYEGIDDRVMKHAQARMRVEEVSIGDYVLAGGEPAVLVMTEAICRLLPGVLGNAESLPDDSFGAAGGPMAGLVEGPVYTRPRTWRGLDVPPVLLSGDHGAIARWRRDEALRRTARNRPDLIRRLASGDEGGLGAAGEPDAGAEGGLGAAGEPAAGHQGGLGAAGVPAGAGDHGAAGESAAAKDLGASAEPGGEWAPARLDDHDREVLSQAGFPVSAEDVAH